MSLAKTALLALIWLALRGDYSVVNLGFGLALAAVCLALAHPLRGPGFARVRLLKLPGFVLYFLWVVLLSNLRMIQVVLGPRRLVRPVLVAVPLEVNRDLEIMLLTCMISLTPGTVSLELSAKHIGFANPVDRSQGHHHRAIRLLSALALVRSANIFRDHDAR